jgi:predicted nucleotidyltransferase
MPTTPELEKVAEVLRRHLPSGEYRAVLFGSRATGRARVGSDWDIGILGPQPLRGATVQAIRDELDELRTLHSFDVVDLTTVPDSFRAIALQQAINLV